MVETKKYVIGYNVKKTKTIKAKSMDKALEDFTKNFIKDSDKVEVSHCVLY